MNGEELVKVHKARPFLPFTIHVNDGRHVYVPHPEWMAHIPNSRIVTAHDPAGGVEIIDILAISSIAVGKNGSHRKPPRHKKRK